MEHLCLWLTPPRINHCPLLQLMEVKARPPKLPRQPHTVPFQEPGSGVGLPSSHPGLVVSHYSTMCCWRCFYSSFSSLYQGLLFYFFFNFSFLFFFLTLFARSSCERAAGPPTSIIVSPCPWQPLKNSPSLAKQQLPPPPDGAPNSHESVF